MKREKPMNEQNRENEAKDRNTLRQETERENRHGSDHEDWNTRRDCHQTETCGGKRHSKKKGQRKMTKERNLKTENTFSILENHYWKKKNCPQLSK